ncbi:MAG: hypothetical protein P9M14_10240 [Candidatus Alcyoniella australis]|nr:hypothetical protein [Candidatus Alcyoniella australis]
MNQRTICVIVFALLIALCSAAWAGPVSDKLTPEEIEQLKAGEWVMKKNIGEDGSSGAGVIFGVFNCKLATFWEIVYDYPHYGELFPPIIRAEVTKGELGYERFWTEIEMHFPITNVIYTNYNDATPDDMRLDFVMDKEYPHKHIAAIDGYWQLEPLGEDCYLAEYLAEVELDINAVFKALLTPIFNALTGRDLPKMMDTYRREINKREGRTGDNPA